MKHNKEYRMESGNIAFLAKFCVFVFLLLTSCVSFEQFTLDDDADSELIAKADSVQKVSDTASILLDHFDAGLGWQWWTTDRIKISTFKSSIVAQGNKVGPDWGCFGKNLGGAIDLSRNQVLKLRVSAEGEVKAPELQITLRDGDKHETNGKPQRIKIPVDGKFRDFYINMTDRWIQTWPNKKTVNPAIITDMLIFINPGGRPFSGVIQIDYIEAIPLSQMPEGADVVPFNGVVDTFDDDNMIWWMTDNIDLDIEDSAMKVTCHGVGPKSECLGRRFETVDATKFQVVKLRVKAPAGKTPLQLKVMIQDSRENLTDVWPMEINPVMDGQFRDYYYSYAGKFAQLPQSKGPDRQKVNPKDIVQILIYPNQGGTPFEGDFFVDDVRFIHADSIPKGININKYGSIDDFTSTELIQWTSGSDKIVLSATDGALSINMQPGITAENFFSRSFERLDFENFPVLRFKAKVESNVKPELRIDLKDSEGNLISTDSVYTILNNDGKFSEYTVNFKQKFSERDSTSKINPGNITAVYFYPRVSVPGESSPGRIILDDLRITSK